MITAPRFDWSFNFGHVLQTIGMAITITGGVWWTSSKFENIENRIAASETRAATWIPRVEAMQKSQDVQDERIQNMALTIREGRDGQQKVIDKLSKVGEDLAAIKARMNIPDRN